MYFIRRCTGILTGSYKIHVQCNPVIIYFKGKADLVSNVHNMQSASRKTFYLHFDSIKHNDITLLSCYDIFLEEKTAGRTRLNRR